MNDEVKQHSLSLAPATCFTLRRVADHGLVRARMHLIRIAVLAAAFVTVPLCCAEPRVTYSPVQDVMSMFTNVYTCEYPLEARRRRMEGSGRFRMYIDEQGVVTKIGILKSTGHRMLDINACNALSHWRAKPGRRREVDMPMAFKLFR